MRYRTTRRGLKLSELGFGAAQLGNLFRELTDEQARGAVDAAWDSGVRYFDTAPHYGLGLSERRLGALLARRPRDEFVISSKVGRVLEPSPTTADRLDDEGFAVPASMVRRWDFSRDGILRSFEDTLTRTGLDRIDVLYLHDPDNHFEEASTVGIDALIELREQGLVRAVGAGMNHAAPLAELIRRADVDQVMVAGRYTLLDQSAADDLLPLALEREVAVVVAGVYNSGILGMDRPSASAKFHYETAPAALVERAGDIARVCEGRSVTLPEAALAFALLHPAVASIVVGARDAQQAASTAARYSASIPPMLWTDLRDAGLLPAEV